MAVDEHILYSGGAVGSDSVFGVYAEQHGITEQHYSYRGQAPCRSRGRVILTDEQLAAADNDLNAVLGPAGFASANPSGHTWRYWQLNWYQVRLTDEVFAVAKDIENFLGPSSARLEGASVAVIVAIANRPRCQRIFVFDQTMAQWHVWHRNSSQVAWPASHPLFEPIPADQVVIRGPDFTGIGTRSINNCGVNAVTELFNRSFCEGG